MATGNGGQVHIVYDMIYAQSCIELERPEAVVHLSVFTMRLPSIVERCIEVILPDKVLLRQVPVADAIVAMLAVGCVLIAELQRAGLAVMQLVGESSIAVPMVFSLIASCALLSCTVQVEHVALRVFLREAVVAEAIRDINLVAPFVEFPSVVDGCLKEVFRQLVAVVAVKQVRRLTRQIGHVTASRVDSSAALQVNTEVMPAIIELISAVANEGTEVSKTCAVGIGGDSRAVCRGLFLLFELALIVNVGALSSYIYIMVSCAIVDFRVERERAPRRGSTVDGNVPTVRLTSFRNDIDDAHIAVSLVLGRWGS